MMMMMMSIVMMIIIDRRRRVDDVMMMLGLGPHRHTVVGDAACRGLSGGQLRREWLLFVLNKFINDYPCSGGMNRFKYWS